MTPPPVVSVVMAAYNGAALIAETLASLRAQTFDAWEAIVVDDCSTDATRAVVAAWPDARVRLVTADVNGGPVVARNIAFANARGRYVAGLDQDDICLPDRFAAQVAYLDAHPATVLVATDATVFDDAGDRPMARAPATTPALIDWLLHIQNPLVWSSVMLRADAARGLVPFERPERRYVEDFDLYHRIRRLGAVARIDRVLLRYRDHPAGASVRYRDTMLAGAAAVLHEAWAPRIGAGAAAQAVPPLVAHLIDGAPVGDLATLAALGGTLARLQAAHLSHAAPGLDDRARIVAETRRLWWRIVRHAVRSGTLPPLAALRTAHRTLGLGAARAHDVAATALLGLIRR